MSVLDLILQRFETMTDEEIIEATSYKSTAEEIIPLCWADHSECYSPLECDFCERRIR